MAALSFEEALDRLVQHARKVKGTDRVALAAANGRILAETVCSAIDVPPHDNSAMDGYALRCADVTTAGVRLPVAQRIAAGDQAIALAPGSAARIFTGAPVPAGADAVIMQEDCLADGTGGDVLVNRVPRPGDNIRRAGEDIRSGAEILAAGTVLTPAALGLAASVGLGELPVVRRLSVGVMSTGNELLAPGVPLAPGKIYNSNRYLLVGLLQQLGCDVVDYEPVPDDLEATRRALRKAGAIHDLVITSGGVSVGDEDHVRQAVQAEGELTLWSVAIKPGKPLAFGKVGDADFVGLPGNPVSAFATFLMLIRPFIRKCQGAPRLLPEPRSAVAGFDWLKPGNRREFLRVRMGSDDRLERFPHQGSGVLTSCVWADGFADVPAGQKIVPGDTVRYIRFADLP